MDRREEEAEPKQRRTKSKEDESTLKFFEMIPLDLIPDILLRLPAKSVARFRCVSKLWSSITTRQDFITSFATQSSTRMCLLVGVISNDKRLFISLPQHEHRDISYSRVDRFQIKCPRFDIYELSESVNGLICFGDIGGNIVVWNRTMRQHVTLPKPKVGCVCSCLGYDPVEDKYKVVCISRSILEDPLVFTLGSPESWRVAQNSPKHFHLCTTERIGICINGHVYYTGWIPFGVDTIINGKTLMSFDVRYEKFNIIRKPADDQLSSLLINYQGKLAWVCSDLSCIRFWVLEDKEKQEWSSRRFHLPFIVPLCDPNSGVCLALRGITNDTGEFIYAATTFEAICVLYYDPKSNRTRRVRVGLEIDNEDIILYYPNHSDSLMSLDNVPCLI